MVTQRFFINKLYMVGKNPWRRERLPTPVFWPGEFRRLCSPRGRKESDTTEQLSTHAAHGSAEAVWLVSERFFSSKGLPCGSAGKESTCRKKLKKRIHKQCRRPGSIHRLGRCPGEGKGYPLQYSGLENPRDCIVHGVTKSWTRLRDCHFHVTCISQ